MKNLPITRSNRIKGVGEESDTVLGIAETFYGTMFVDGKRGQRLSMGISGTKWHRKLSCLAENEALIMERLCAKRRKAKPAGE